MVSDRGNSDLANFVLVERFGGVGAITRPTFVLLQRLVVLPGVDVVVFVFFDKRWESARLQSPADVTFGALGRFLVVGLGPGYQKTSDVVVSEKLFWRESSVLLRTAVVLLDDLGETVPKGCPLDVGVVLVFSLLRHQPRHCSSAKTVGAGGDLGVYLGVQRLLLFFDDLPETTSLAWRFVQWRKLAVGVLSSFEAKG